MSLDNVFITDLKEYYTLPTQGPNGKLSTALNDFLLQFPDGYTLAPGQTAVVTQSARLFFLKYYSGLENKTTVNDILAQYSSMDINEAKNRFNNLTSPSPLIFEVADSSSANSIGQPLDGVPKMTRRIVDDPARALNLNLSNSGEFVVLFY